MDFGTQFPYKRLGMTPSPQFPAHLDGFGGLTVRGGVMSVQAAILGTLGWGQENGMPASLRIPAGMVVDGKYGPVTHLGFKRMIHVLVRLGRCGGGYSPAQIDADGPNSAKDCAMSAPLPVSSANMDEAQAGWMEWKAAQRSPDPTPDAVTPVDSTPADDVPVLPGAPSPRLPADTGMSTSSWLLLAVAGALVVGGIYYVATGD